MAGNRLCLPVADWPEADRQLWQEGVRPRALFDDATAGTDWAPLSRDKVAKGYGRWLRFLIDAGRLDPTTAPGMRMTRDNVAAYLDQLRAEVAPYTVMSRLQDLHNAMRLLAPRQNFAWLLKLWQSMRARAVPVRQKRQRLRPADELVRLGLQLMAAAEAEPDRSPRWRAVEYRDGLMIALLAHRPLRLRNFAGIRLGQHLVESRGRIWLLVTAPETKSRRDHDAPFPALLLPHLQRYLQRHRPVLLAGERGGIADGTDYLWVGETGLPYQPDPLSRRVAMRTENAFGRSMSAHLFRDAAATTIAIDNPAFVRDAQLVLGHAQMATTEQHYILAQSLQAGRRHQAVLGSLISPQSIAPEETP